MGTLHANVRSLMVVNGGLSIATSLLIACASMPIFKTGDRNETIRVTVLRIHMTTVFAGYTATSLLV